MRMKNVIIVSAYGRGVCLAHQLQSKGFETTVLDVTSLLPALSSPEREGPFGVFLPSNLSDLQKQYLCGDSFYPVQQGFSVFTPKGPLEFQGPLSSFFMAVRKDFKLCYSILSHASEVGNVDLSIKKKTQVIKKFEDSSRLLYLAAELTDSYMESVASIENRVFSPLFSDYIFRESSQGYFSDLKYSLQEEGVKWTSVTSTEEILSLFNKIKKQKDDFLIWTLSGPETDRHFSDGMPLLFPKWIAPVKIWRRFPLSWDQKGFENIIPSLLLVWLDYTQKKEKSLYYASESLLSLKKNPDSSSIDLWMLCPYAERFNELTLSTCLQSALEQLRFLFPDCSIKGFLPEADSCHDYFVLYKNGNAWKGRKKYKKPHPRLFHLNPEATGKMDAYSLMQQSHWIWEDLLKKHNG